MCLVKSPLRNLSRWNWDGDVIIRDSVVPSSRPVVGSHSLKKQYDIDVREFLVTAGNAVMRRTLHEVVPGFLKEIDGDLGRFQCRDRGAFDYRADILSAFVAQKIKYRTRKRQDPWQFPDETLFLKTGDCEDRAFLIASLLLAAGISSFNVRVALGKFRHHRPGQAPRDYDHAWVMYKNEAGNWTVLEPLHLGSDHARPRNLTRKLLRARTGQVEYLPTFLFNETHLWRVRRPEHDDTLDTVRRKEWTRLDPKFAGEVHQTLLNKALQGISPPWVLDALNRNFHHIFLVGPVVDEVDNVLVHAYDPRDHFDNGFIPEGWDFVAQRLASFSADNQDLNSFALAAHGIADFYAHSSYLHFARLLNPADEENGRAEPYDPQNPGPLLEGPPDYSAGTTCDLTSHRFSVNAYYWKATRQAAADAWNGKLISGRYAQPRDSHDLIERITNIPKALLSQKDFPSRGALPHHNEIAVDQHDAGSAHKLYSVFSDGPTDRMSFANQFRWRFNTACAHIRAAFQQCWH